MLFNVSLMTSSHVLLAAKLHHGFVSVTRHVQLDMLFAQTLPRSWRNDSDDLHRNA